jgi:hypothetical protein
MTATNHALTGAIIGAAVHQPWLALPAAFLSHYILDMTPHFGVDEDFIKTKGFRYLLYVDALLCVILALVLAVAGPQHWFVVVLGTFLATAPDLFWINKYRYVGQKRLNKWKPNIYSRFASKIQWFEKPIGAAVEVAWFIGALTILLQLLHNAA